MQTGIIQADMQLGDCGGGPKLPSAPQWHVLWTRSNCEQVVHAQLRTKGYELFLPLVGAWNRRRGMRCWSTMPLFPGYLFLRHAMDKYSYLDVCKVRGLVRLLGVRWDRLAVVPDRQIESVRRVLQSDSPARRLRLSVRGPIGAHRRRSAREHRGSTVAGGAAQGTVGGVHRAARAQRGC